LEKTNEIGFDIEKKNDCEAQILFLSLLQFICFVIRFRGTLHNRVA